MSNTCSVHECVIILASCVYSGLGYTMWLGCCYWLGYTTISCYIHSFKTRVRFSPYRMLKSTVNTHCKVFFNQLWGEGQSKILPRAYLASNGKTRH